MSLVMEILEDLWNAELNYKGISVNFFGIPKFLLTDRQDRKNSFRTTLSRLHKKGYVKSDNSGKWALTSKGKKYFSYKKIALRQFNFPLVKNVSRNIIIMFDIPESKSHERYWFRKHLRKLNYIMIQKSVWVGPGPLPKSFMQYINEIGLQKCLKQFKLAKPYIDRH